MLECERSVRVIESVHVADDDGEMLLYFGFVTCLMFGVCLCVYGIYTQDTVVFDILKIPPQKIKVIGPFS